MQITNRTFIAAAIAACLCSIAWGAGLPTVQASEGRERKSCGLRTLHGTFLFAASGFNIVNGVAVPKAIQETIEFNGDGTLSVPAVSLSVNGAISHPPPSVGNYTVDAECRGTVVFSGGPSFDIVADGGTVWMFQTNPNTVFQGKATRLHR